MFLLTVILYVQDYLSASSDLQEVLQVDPNVREAEQELEVVTSLLRQSLMDGTANTPTVRPYSHPHLESQDTMTSCDVFTGWCSSCVTHTDAKEKQTFRLTFVYVLQV